MKINNKTLGIAFAALLLIYFAGKFLGGDKERSFDPQILSIDTAQVTKLMIDPANDEPPFILERTGSGWGLTKDGKTYGATSLSVNSLMGNLLSVKAERVVSKNPERHRDYSVDDTTGTRIEIMAGSKKLADVVVGRFNFNQATRSGISYIRLQEQPAVYSVDGFLSMSLSQGADNYRNKQLTSLNAEDITKISLDDDAGVQKSYQLAGASWQDESGNAIDSAKMVSYLNNIKSVMGVTFVADPSTQMSEKISSLRIEGNNMSGPLDVNIYNAQDTSQQFVVHSTANPEGYFYSDSSGVYQRLIGSFDDPRNSDDE